MNRTFVSAIVFVAASGLLLSTVKSADSTENPHRTTMDFRRAPAVQLSRMLYHREVRAKFDVTDAEFSLLRTRLRSITDAVPSLDEFASSDTPQREKLLERICEAAEKIDGEVYASRA